MAKRIVCPTCGRGTIPRALHDLGRRTCDSCDPRHHGLVHCCVTLGWVKPAEAYDHRYPAPVPW